MRFESDSIGARLGSKVGLADSDGDGLSDVFIGAPRDNPSGLNTTFYSGSLYLFLGKEVLTAPDGFLGTKEAATTWHAPKGYRRVGMAFALGDLDGDSLTDLFLLMGDD
jgi:hypothetical protein